MRSRDKITSKEDRNPAKASELGVTASMSGSSLGEEEQQPPRANTEGVVLDAAFRQAIQEITANRTRVIDEKLGPLSHTLQDHTQQLKKIEERTTETENRIAADEHACEVVDSRVQVLEKQIQNMAEHIDDLENRGRRKNVRIIGLPEEGEQPDTVFPELDT